MKVSDKDFDQLFNAKLGDMEMEPSPMIWDNIAKELDGKSKEKTNGLPFMRIAAGVIVLLTAGLFFIRPEHQVINLRGTTINVSNIGKASATVISTPTIDTITETTAQVIQPAKRQTSYGKTIKAERLTTKSLDTAQRINTYTAAVQAQSVIPVIVQPTQPSTTATVQQNTVIADVKTNRVITGSSTPDVVKTNTMIVIPNQAIAKAAEPVKKKRIHSLGDLLNVVIAKVDKRQDKIIEFTNSNDDDDSFNITGLNLGIIKTKKNN